MAEDLFKVSLECDDNPNIRSVLLTGEGDKAFCAGGDLHSFYEYGKKISSHLKEVTTTLHGAISRFSRMNAPLVLAVNGVAAGAGLQFAFGLGAMMGPFLCSFFMDFVGANGFFIYLILFHSCIGVFGIYRMKVRAVVDNPDSQFTPIPQTITPLGLELSPVAEHIDEPYSESVQKMLKRKGVVIKKKEEKIS